MKTNLFLDPYVLACPKPEAGIPALEAYIENLILWSELRSAEWISFYSSANTFLLLSDNDANLRLLIGSAGKTYQHQDVKKILDGLLSRALWVEETVKLIDILLDSVVVLPTEHLDGRPSPFVDEYSRFFALICLFREFRSASPDSHFLITHGLAKNAETVSISGKIADYEYIEPREESYPVPYALNGRLQACSNRNGLFSLLQPVALWADASSEPEYKLALEVYLHQRPNDLELPSENVRKSTWSLGKHFLEHAQKHSFLDKEPNIEKLLRACAEVILEKNPSDTHLLRTDRGAESSPKRRGEDKAWRRDIDRKYHLHYWQTSNGPELASVVVHDDFSIPE